MKLQHLGSNYGGWTIDVDLIKDGDTIIDAGLGEDITFDQELSKIKNIKIIDIDPTPKSHKFIERLNLPNLTLIKKAVEVNDGEIINMYKNTNPEWVSESTFSDHANVDKQNYYEVDTVSLKTLIKKHNPSLVKLDIEGTEYEVLSDCIGVRQICVEFHHSQINGKSLIDTNVEIENLKNNGYTILHNTQNYQEVTFIKQ